MREFFRDSIIEFNQYNLEKNEDIFKRILEERKGSIDAERFFLSFISSEDLSRFNFNDKESLKEFRDVCLTSHSPIIRMGGCNLREEDLKKDLIYGGIKISDPYGKIFGQFDIRDKVITYSPLYPLFYEARDISKFANDKYFTSLTFEEIILNQIEEADKYYIHSGYNTKIQSMLKYGRNILEEVDKDQMIECATNPEVGQRILRKHFNLEQ